MSRCALRTAYLHRHWQVTKLTDANQVEAKREVLHRFPESQEIFDTIERNVDNMVSTQESQSLRPGGEAGSASAVLHILRVVVPLPQLSAVCMALSQSLSLFPPPPLHPILFDKQHHHSALVCLSLVRWLARTRGAKVD